MNYISKNSYSKGERGNLNFKEKKQKQDESKVGKERQWKPSGLPVGHGGVCGAGRSSGLLAQPEVGAGSNSPHRNLRTEASFGWS